MSNLHSLTSGFPARRRADWEALVRGAGAGGASGSERRGAAGAALEQATADGIALRPLYLPEDGLPSSAASFPGAPPFVRGASASGSVQQGWDLRPLRSEPRPEDCNAAILEDLEGGATSIALRIAAPGSGGGLDLARLEDLDRALEGVHLPAIELGIEAGAAFLPVSAAVVALLRRRGLDPRSQRLSLGADPFGALARGGELPQGLETALGELAELARFALAEMPAATVACTDGGPYHDAGASNVLELACVLATGVAHLRAMGDGRIEPRRALPLIELSLALDADLFSGIAKLRAARRLWSRVAEECGVAGAAESLRLRARAGLRMLSSHDPLLDLLRVATAALAAAAGGARTITTPAFDEVGGAPSALGRRLARNAQLVLAEEAHLHRVLDPAGGSWYVEHLTEAMCERAWERFRELESRGGILAALADGSLQDELAEAAAASQQAVATRRETVVGVNRFAAPAAPAAPTAEAGPPVLARALVRGAASVEEWVERWSADFDGRAGERPEHARPGRTAHRATTVRALPARRHASAFDDLRDRADRWRARAGARPRVFLAALGGQRDHLARVDWARDLFAAAGLDSVVARGGDDPLELAEAFRAAGTPIACLCSSDPLYAEQGEPVARALRSAGAGRLLVAGQPPADSELESRLRRSGVDELVYEGADALAALRRVWDAFESGGRERETAARAQAAGDGA
jgi:methylmalonyl-CoA mutase